jgi:hypothetical protein
LRRIGLSKGGWLGFFVDEEAVVAVGLAALGPATLGTPRLERGRAKVMSSWAGPPIVWLCLFKDDHEVAVRILGKRILFLH